MFLSPVEKVYSYSAGFKLIGFTPITQSNGTRETRR